MRRASIFATFVLACILAPALGDVTPTDDGLGAVLASPSPRAPRPPPRAPRSPPRPPRNPPSPRPPPKPRPSPRPPSPRPAPLPPGNCRACWSWEVVSNNNRNQPKWSFLTKGSCDFPTSGRSPDGTVQFKNCCDYAAYSIMQAVGEWKNATEPGMVYGFEKYACTATRLTVCGAFANATVGKLVTNGTFLSDIGSGLAFDQDGLSNTFDISDDQCPMALYGSTLQRYLGRSDGSMATKNDNRCTVSALETRPGCTPPSRNDSMGPTDAFFPSQDCDDTPGTTPFMVDDRYVQLASADAPTYCLPILANPKPLNASTVCGRNTSRLNTIAFWVNTGRRADFTNITLVFANKTTITPKASWGAARTGTLTLPGVALDLATVKAQRPRVCFELVPGATLGAAMKDAFGHLWTALYTSTCCPVYYSNRL